MGWFKKAFYYPKKLKKEAQPFWEDKAGGEFNRGHKYQKMPGAFNKYMAFVHKSNALAYYGAAAASKLAPNNLATLALDIVSMGRGSVLTRVVGKSVAFLRGTRAVARSSRAARGLDSVGKAAKAWSDTGSKLFKGRKAVKLGTTAARSLYGYDGTVSNRNANVLIPRPTLPNIASQIRVTLPQSRKSTKRQLPPLNRIKGLPKFKDGIVPSSNIGDIFKSKYMDKMRKHVSPLRLHKPSVPPPFKHVPSKPTSGIGAGSRPFNWKSNAIPPKPLQNTFRPDRTGQPGWGLEVNRSRPANPLKNMWQQGNRFSPLMQQPMQKRVSAPPMRPFQSNPLRQMSQGLMNPNRARPMFR